MSYTNLSMAERQHRADDALFSIRPPEDYQSWLNLSIAYKVAGGQFPQWLEWCARGSNPIPEQQAPAKWQSFSEDGGITEALLFKTALESGWSDSQSQGRPDRRPAAEPVHIRPNPEKIAKAVSYLAECREHLDEAVSYLATRGITKATAERFAVGFDKAKNALVIPYKGSEYYILRYVDPEQSGRRYEYPPKEIAGEKRLFNAEALRASVPTVFVTEGQINAMSIEQCGGVAVGCNEAKLLTEEICKVIADTGKFDKTLIIVPDNDKTGVSKAAKIKEALQGIAPVIIDRLPAQFNDSNDFLLAEPDKFQKWIAGESGSNATLLDGYISQWESLAGGDAYPTGFPKLDEALDGGLYPGLYVFGALSSMGKTTFALQVADQIAEQGKDVLYIALEQSAAELTAKSLSRLTAIISQKDGLGISQKLTFRDITSARRRAQWGERSKKAFAGAVERYRNGAGKHLFFREGLGDISVQQIRDFVTAHIARRGQAPMVFVDYGQIIAPWNEKATDKMNVDHNIVDLKRLSRDFNIPVFVISSFNRASYYEKITQSAFKESGAIEYTADVLMGLQPYGMLDDDDDKSRAANKAKVKAIRSFAEREIELTVVKNRNGSISATGFMFRANVSLFEEHAPVQTFSANGVPVTIGEAPKVQRF